MSKENPAVVAALVNVIPGVINSVANIFKDKKKSKEGASLVPPLMSGADEIAKGIELSSKSVMGYGLGGVIISYALATDLSQRHNLIIFLAGCLVVCVTTIAKVFEK